MVLVDGEEWDDAEINGNEITVMFLAGAEEIEIFGTHVIPEFGAIAAIDSSSSNYFNNCSVCKI